VRVTHFLRFTFKTLQVNKSTNIASDYLDLHKRSWNTLLDVSGS
jgi:hypothetical protein